VWNAIQSILSSDTLSPHGICLLWRPELIWLHLTSDAVIGLAYFSIPIALAVFHSKRQDVNFGWVIWSFAIFIVSCGATHFFAIWTLYVPDYGAEGLVKAFTAVASLATAIALWPLLPKALAIPSVQQLQGSNDALRLALAERNAAMHALQDKNLELELVATACCEAQKRLEDSERSARETATIVQSTLAHMSQGLSMFDGDGRLLAWNDLYRAMYGLPPELIQRGTTVKSILEYQQTKGHIDQEVDGFIAAFLGDMVIHGVSTTKLRLADGRVMSIVATLVEGGGWVATHEDITERERTELRIAHLAYHDGLTGLLNRAGFRNRGDTMLAQTGVRCRSVGILLIDLDRFKAVNDTHGHKAGDSLLISCAARLQSSLRADEVVARLGGDEFVILLEGGANLAEVATGLSSRLLNMLSAPYDLDGINTSIGVSIGVAVSSAADETIESLMHKADLALYEVKSQGRDDYCMYQDELGNRAQERREIEQDLREATADSALQLYYQPIVSLLDDSICGMEALLRWRHPTRGMLPPSAFISMAEESALIVPLSKFVIRQACLDAAKWPAHVKVSINISPAHLRRGGVVNMVRQALEEANIQAARLVVEVTETVLLQDDGQMLSELQQLKSLGLSIALDDFGTGFSSLSYLRMFPFDQIKIDRSFVSEITSRSDSAAIVCAVAGLARSLDMTTTAEGVENADQLAMIKAAGCVQGQGYFFGKPQPVRAYFPDIFAAAAD